MTTDDARKRARDLALRTVDAAGFDYYGGDRWLASVRMLCDRGYTDVQVEGILRSKIMRWAADASGAAYGETTSADLAAFLDEHPSYASLPLEAE